MYAIPITQPGKTPAYTLEDVRAHVATYSGGDLATVSGAPFSIDTVEFVGPEQAEQMTHDAAHGVVASDDLVCIVRLTGPFSGQGMSLAPSARKRWSPTYATLVFDAHTGRPIMQGFHD
ncbi:MAG TPA: hypothetical protein VKQ36_11145 [Ktedonobacterales bacterium]|nr:hypothetical protein [Ktedonobacterales bacterium]